MQKSVKENDVLNYEKLLIFLSLGLDAKNKDSFIVTQCHGDQCRAQKEMSRKGQCWEYPEVVCLRVGDQ